MPRPTATQMSLLDQIVAMDSNDDPVIGYTPLELAQCAWPQVKPRNERRVWTRRNGDLTLTITSGTNKDETAVGLPYGPKIRVLCAYFCGEMLRKNTNVVELGPSLNGFMDRLGYQSKSSGKNGNKPIVGEQIRRFLRAQLEIEWDTTNPLHERAGGMRFADMWDVWWDRSENPTHPVEGSFITFTPQFRALVEESVPINLEALLILGGSALAQDMYTFFCGRLHRLTRPLRLSWEQLAMQFGNGPMPTDAREKTIFVSATKARIKEQMPLVLATYHDARVELVDDGLILKQSPPHLPSRGLHRLTRVRRAETLPARQAAAAAADLHKQMALPVAAS